MLGILLSCVIRNQNKIQNPKQKPIISYHTLFHIPIVKNCLYINYAYS